MLCDVNAPSRAPFLQTPNALIDDASLSDAAVRLLQAMVKLAPRNVRNSDAVAARLSMGKDKTNAARKSLRTCGHWHARKRQNNEGHIRDQRMASLAPLRTPEEIAAGWDAAEEAARLGKDTAVSRKLGVRILNSAAWQRRTSLPPRPAAGQAVARVSRRRLPTGEEKSQHKTPHPLPATAVPASTLGYPLPEVTRPAPDFEGISLIGPLAPYAERAEQTLLRLRRREPRLTLTTTDARELAHLAGHFLLRGETTANLFATLTQGLPPEGVHHPAAFVRNRLRRYMPPLPAWPLPAEAAPRRTAAASERTRAESEPPRTAPDEPVTRPGGPADLLAQGKGWRAICAELRDERAGDADCAGERGE